MSAKKNRQLKILEIVAEHEVSTQEELISLLRVEGVEATQATISRDIRELRLKKDRRGYAMTEQEKKAPTGEESYDGVMRSSIVSVEPAGNIVVIKTLAGVAMAVAAAIDHKNNDIVVGCIAGDDTIFVAVRDASLAEGFINEIKSGYIR